MLLLGGVRDPRFLLRPTFAVLVRPRLLRTCFSIQARRLVRLLCSDSTIRGHGLHSAMSSAAMARARPTWGVGCGSVSSPSNLVLFGGVVHSMTGREEARPNSGYSEWCALVLYLKSIYNLLFRAEAGVHGTRNFPEERACAVYNLQFYFSYVPRKRYTKTTIMGCF